MAHGENFPNKLRGNEHVKEFNDCFDCNFHDLASIAIFTRQNKLIIAQNAILVNLSETGLKTSSTRSKIGQLANKGTRERRAGNVATGQTATIHPFVISSVL